MGPRRLHCLAVAVGHLSKLDCSLGCSFDFRARGVFSPDCRLHPRPQLSASMPKQSTFPTCTKIQTLCCPRGGGPKGAREAGHRLSSSRAGLSARNQQPAVPAACGPRAGCGGAHAGCGRGTGHATGRFWNLISGSFLGPDSPFLTLRCPSVLARLFQT